MQSSWLLWQNFRILSSLFGESYSEKDILSHNWLQERQRKATLADSRLQSQQECSSARDGSACGLALVLLLVLLVLVLLLILSLPFFLFIILLSFSLIFFMFYFVLFYNPFICSFLFTIKLLSSFSLVQLPPLTPTSAELFGEHRHFLHFCFGLVATFGGAFGGLMLSSVKRRFNVFFIDVKHHDSSHLIKDKKQTIEKNNATLLFSLLFPALCSFLNSAFWFTRSHIPSTHSTHHQHFRFNRKKKSRIPPILHVDWFSTTSISHTNTHTGQRCWLPPSRTRRLPRPSRRRPRSRSDRVRVRHSADRTRLMLSIHLAFLKEGKDDLVIWNVVNEP